MRKMKDVEDEKDEESKKDEKDEEDDEEDDYFFAPWRLKSVPSFGAAVWPHLRCPLDVLSW